MKKLVFILCVGILLCGCSSDGVEEPTTGSIEGSVSDKTTGEPIATAIVTLSPGGKSTVTGSDGCFSFVDLAAGSYKLDITKEGYKPASITVSMKTGHVSSHLLLERIPSKITADRTEVDFGDSYDVNTLSFNIVNNYYEDLEWEITHSCAWIKEVKPVSGTLAHGKTGTIVVIIDRELLTAGTNETYLIVTTKNGNGSVEVKLKATGTDRRLAVLNVLDATDIAASSAKFNANMTDAGFPSFTERGFVYHTKTTPSLENTIERLSVPVTANLDFSYVAHGLELGKHYYVRAYAINEVGISYSANQISFTTEAVPAVVTMNSISNIDIIAGTAIFYGTVTAAGDPSYSEKGFVYSATSTIPTVYDTKMAVAGTGTGMYEARIEGLQRNTTYYVRAYANNEAGIVYSDVSTFDTDEVLPAVRTDAATDEDRDHNSVVLHGTVVDSGMPAYTERGFVYSDVYESPTIYDNKFIVEGSGNTSFEYRVTELSADKVYYVRAYATNSKGTAYGESTKIFRPIDVVILSSANLMVQPDDIGNSNWKSVNSMCENSTHADYTDWRLPTKEELMTLYTNRNTIGNFWTDYYWSSSYAGRGGSGDLYYYVYFSTGTLSSNYISNRYRARCVRTLNPTAANNPR